MLAEKLIYQIISEAFEDEQIDVCPTVFHNFTQTAIRVGNCESRLSPHFDGTIKEFNAKLRIEILDKVGTDEAENYLISLEKVFDISVKLAETFLNNSGLAGAYCSLTLDECYRTVAKINGSPHAIAFMLITINPL
jgi:hypothetical protein